MLMLAMLVTFRVLMLSGGITCIGRLDFEILSQKHVSAGSGLMNYA
jgi:hypothetical protein